MHRWVDRFWVDDTSNASRRAKKKGLKPFEIEFIPDIISLAAPKMVRAGSEILEPIVRRKLEQTIGNPGYLVSGAKSKSTGSLVNSIRVSNTFIRDNGTRFFANVFFDGYDKRGMRQGEKAAYLHYGTGKGGTRVRTTGNGNRASTGNTVATKFATRAANSAKANVHAAMQAILERELREEHF
jgi:hypothetical protein